MRGTGLNNMTLERDFQKILINDIKERFPEAIVKKNDPNIFREYQI